MLNIKATEFLSNFPGHCLVAYDDKKKGRKYTGGFFGEEASKRESFEKLIDMNKREAGIFFSVNSFPEVRRAMLCSGINAWWVERDAKKLKDGTVINSKEQQQKDIDAGPLEPSIIIESRNSLHTYWLAKDGTIDNFNKILDRVCDYYKGDKGAKGVNRVLRIPGFQHRKEDEAFTVKIIKYNPELKYTEEQMLEVYPEIAEENKTEYIPKPVDAKEKKFRDFIYKLDCRYMIGRLSGGSMVDGESCTFKKRRGGGYHILFNGKEGNCYIAPDGMIASPLGGGPDIFAWLTYYRNTPTEIYKYFWDECRDLIPENIKEEAIEYMKNKDKPQEEEAEETEEKKPAPRFEIKSWDSILVSAQKELENLKEEDVLGYGYDFLDEPLGGIYKGELVLIGGITSTGKSTLVRHIAHNVANKGKKVVMLALEERLNTLATKEIVYELNRGRASGFYNLVKVMKGEQKITPEEFDEARGRLENGNISFVKARQQLTPGDLSAIYSMYPADLYILDHLHYFNVHAKDKSKADSIEQTMQAIKEVTIKNDTRTIMVAHFQKIDEAKRPTMTNFKDSISVAQTADTILMLWRDKSCSKEKQTQYETEFIVTKSRLDVPAQTINATFDINTNTYRRQTGGVTFGTPNSEIGQYYQVAEKSKRQAAQSAFDCADDLI